MAHIKVNNCVSPAFLILGTMVNMILKFSLIIMLPMNTLLAALVLVLQQSLIVDSRFLLLRLLKNARAKVVNGVRQVTAIADSRG